MREKKYFFDKNEISLLIYNRKEKKSMQSDGPLLKYKKNK